MRDKEYWVTKAVGVWVLILSSFFWYYTYIFSSSWFGHGFEPIEAFFCVSSLIFAIWLTTKGVEFLLYWETVE